MTARELKPLKGGTPFARTVLRIWFEREGVDHRWKSDWKEIPDVPAEYFEAARARLAEARPAGRAG